MIVQCYALSGLQTPDPEEYKKIASAYAKSTEQVETMSGCIATNQSLATIIKSMNERLNDIDSTPKKKKIVP